MMRNSAGCRRGTLVLLAVVFFAVVGAASASPIWERAGPFQACLEARFKEWVDRRAELVVNDDPAASDVDDAKVAAWVAGTLELCRTRAGSSDAESEERFALHMVSWREHIYNLSQSIIRRSGGPD